jgi:hypothetical protein
MQLLFVGPEVWGDVFLPNVGLANTAILSIIFQRVELFVAATARIPNLYAFLLKCVIIDILVARASSHGESQDGHLVIFAVSDVL